MHNRVLAFVCVLQLATHPVFGQSIPRQRVSSSVIASAGYDRASKILALEFRQGSIYQYFSVPDRVYAELMTAPSKGKYFHARIKGRYRFKRVG